MHGSDPGVAQLVGRLVWDQDAASSSLATRTKSPESACAESGLFCLYGARLEPIHQYLKDEEQLGTVRIGIGRNTTEEEIDALYEALVELTE